MEMSNRCDEIGNSKGRYLSGFNKCFFGMLRASVSVHYSLFLRMDDAEMVP